jgi:hypothetical protein
MPQGIAFSLQDYCELVDTTGRIIQADKVGAIDSAQSHILSRLGLTEEQWLSSDKRDLGISDSFQFLLFQWVLSKLSTVQKTVKLLWVVY